MPKKSKLKCYFGCTVDGPLHHFPKWDYLNSEKFESWKAVLDVTTQEKGNNYISNSVRICYRHFEECYRLPSSQLTRNAIPSLHLYNTQMQQEPQIIHEQAVQALPSTSHELQSGTHDNTQHEPQHELKQEMPTITLDVKNANSCPCPIKNRPTRYKQEEQLRQKLIALRLKCKTQESRIKAAVKLAKTKSFIEKVEKLPEPIKIFTQLQLKHKKKPRGRKYSLSEKILCLTIYKHSRKAYTWMENLGFVLPSKRTLQKLTAKVCIHPGINYDVMNHLKATVLKMEPEEKYCILIFDEMSLSPGLQYQKFAGEIIGFEDYGYSKTDKIADHVLVLMIKGLKSKFKQPVSYSFCQGATKKEHLKKILIDAIKAINSTGLTVVATVCDQSQTNMSVIKSLFEDTKAEYLRREDELKSLSYEIEGKKIFHLYDPPHLLKGMRNNLLGKDLRYIENGEEKIAKWEHIVMLFETDVGDDEIRLCNRLTEAHVLKEKIPKMKVKHAAQVFSQRVSSAMRFCARHKILPQECVHTADFLLKMDQLFDSFNGHSYQPDKKKFKGPLKRNSNHFMLWKDLLPIFQSMGFKTIKKNGTVAYEKVPSITNFIHNIKTYQEMFEYLNREKGITSLTTRTINQDPLENFFCQIRSHGVRDINPTCEHFISIYKTLLINNFTSPHSVNANCEKDKNKILQPVQHFFDKTPDNQKLRSDSPVDITSLISASYDVKSADNIVHKSAKSYVAGAIIKKARTKIFKNCKVCTKKLLMNTKDLSTKSDYILERDYTKRSLHYPTEEFVNLLNEVYECIVCCLSTTPHDRCLLEKINDYINLMVDFKILTCPKHNLLPTFIKNISTNIIVNSWCTNVNRILKGKLSNFDKSDKIKTQAFNYYVRHSKK